LTRASKEQTEATVQQTLASMRYSDNLGSLVAGFEHAANAYTRANDLYASGEQVFTSLTTAMTEGLAALQGQSSKTFAQIVSDFATMLEQLAIKAAASAIFKALLGGGGGLPGLPTPASVVGGGVSVPAFDALGGGGGGGFFGFLGSIFSAPARAAGGPVDAGRAYTVGENGPERFVPAVAGSIMPTQQTAASQGGVTVNIDMGQTQGAANPSAALDFGRKVRAAVVDVIAQEKRPGGTLYARQNA
jgi:lambda family phage tail tape measure protein